MSDVKVPSSVMGQLFGLMTEMGTRCWEKLMLLINWLLSLLYIRLFCFYPATHTVTQSAAINHWACASEGDGWMDGWKRDMESCSYWDCWFVDRTKTVED